MKFETFCILDYTRSNPYTTRTDLNGSELFHNQSQPDILLDGHICIDVAGSLQNLPIHYKLDEINQNLMISVKAIDHNTEIF